MSNYPLIKKYLPELKENSGIMEEYIHKRDLESALQKATVVYGVKFDKEKDADSVAFALYDDADSTHQGLLLGYQEIEKPLEPVSKEEIIETLTNAYLRNSAINIEPLIERIKKAGVK